MVRRIAFPIAAILLSSAALYAGTGLHPVWWLAWLAPVPVLFEASRRPRGVAFLIALLAWALGDLNVWHYLRDLLGLPIGASLAGVLAPTLIFALVVLLFRSLLRRGAVWEAALSVPAAWVSYEYLLSVLSPHSTFGSIAYSQMDFLPILQLASVTGIWGISFCLLLFPAAVAAVLSPYGTRHKRWLASAVMAFFATVLCFGFWRLEARPPAASVTAGLIASDLPNNLEAGRRDDSLRLFRAYDEQAASLAARGAQVIVLPEKISVAPDSNLHSVDSLFGATAARSGATIVMGLIHPAPTAKWNEARAYSPSGAVASYEKEHMLPAFESSFTSGTVRVTWRAPSGTWGVAICKDMDFPLLSRQYGNDGAGLLLVPAWDFVADGWLHGRMAIMRGVEDGFSIARAPKQGVLTLSDDRGRVIAQKDTGTAPFATLLGSIPVHHDATFYARFGDWFAWCSVAALIFCLSRAFLFGKQA
jgi:apolipoprotein N-acyltransferase